MRIVYRAALRAFELASDPVASIRDKRSDSVAEQD
jgi:hypothetical protein